MTLASKLTTNPTPGQHGLPCPVAVLLAKLPDDEAAALSAALDTESGWQHNAIEAAILSEGHRVGTGTVGKHRRGQCRCSK